MPDKMTAVFGALRYAALVAFGVALGVEAHHRLALAKPAELTFVADDLAKGGFETFADRISAARHSVYLAARRLDSADMQKAIAAAAAAGVDVKLLVDPRFPPQQLRAVLDFEAQALRNRRGGRSGLQVRYTDGRLLDQYMLIDSNSWYFTTAPWVALSESPDVVSSMYLIRNPWASQIVQERFLSTWAKAKAVD